MLMKVISNELFQEPYKEDINSFPASLCGANHQSDILKKKPVSPPVVTLGKELDFGTEIHCLCATERQLDPSS